VIPSDFPDWSEKMDKWGFTMLVEKLKGGAHLLAPTGSDLVKNDVGAIFAGFHYDIAFLTIHGKSRYPGLFVWTREG
jgi:isopenicillin N synthase-like dioxygenase